MLAVLAALFVLSGAAGLFYEAVWSRYLSLFVGHDAYAQILTLVMFLGGMGLGALIVTAPAPLGPARGGPPTLAAPCLDRRRRPARALTRPGRRWRFPSCR